MPSKPDDFMQDAIYGPCDWIECDTSHGTHWIEAEYGGTLPEYPSDDNESAWLAQCYDQLKDYLPIHDAKDLYAVELLQGKYGARLSAPGYTDCTEWSVHDTAEEAQAHLDDMMFHDDCDDKESSQDSAPCEGDYTTDDHCTWYQYGKVAFVLNPEADHVAALRNDMERKQFWPNAWFISDHGNAHLIDLGKD